jgi:hypothetical protein
MKNLIKTNTMFLNEGGWEVYEFGKGKTDGETVWELLQKIPQVMQHFTEVATISTLAINNNDIAVFVVENPHSVFFDEMRSIQKSTYGLKLLRAFLLMNVSEEKTELGLSKAMKDEDIKNVFMILNVPERIALFDDTPWIGQIYPDQGRLSVEGDFWIELEDQRASSINQIFE